jgi:hypothetical protein
LLDTEEITGSILRPAQDDACSVPPWFLVHAAWQGRQWEPRRGAWPLIPTRRSQCAGTKRALAGARTPPTCSTLGTRAIRRLARTLPTCSTPGTRLSASERAACSSAQSSQVPTPGRRGGTTLRYRSPPSVSVSTRRGSLRDEDFSDHNSPLRLRRHDRQRGLFPVNCDCPDSCVGST